MRLLTALTAALFGSLALTSCSSTSAPDPTGAPTPVVPTVTIAAPVGPAPTQPPGKRQPVKFDPCAQIDDAIPTSLGFDPTTRVRADYVFGDYAFIGCKFWRKENVRGQQLDVAGLTIMSTNLTFDEMRARNYEGARPTTVNGKEALFHSSRAAEACNIVMPGPDAMIDVSVSSTYALTDWIGCDHIDEAASTVEAVLPHQ
ncbi:DUF3558 family protein [Nocardia sp. IBHARD005]|uniref:DUF3558 family protein n=1 Tax=Nocardia sp. IBHARD005 TaxID=3457765 RepID=UPI004058A51F